MERGRNISLASLLEEVTILSYRITAKRAVLYLSLLLVTCILFTSCSAQPKTISDGTEYVVIHSRSQQESSGIFGLNGDGELTEELNKSDMQDLSFFAFDDNYLLVSGGRSNDNALFDLSQDGSFSEIHWLNEPKYSGVTAVEIYNKSAFVVMNGNYNDETYLNFVVEQDFAGNVIHQNIIELYCRDILIQNDQASIAGKYIKRNDDKSWQASIIAYDITNQKIIAQHKYEKYNCFWEIESLDGTIYCIAEDKSESKNTICAIDADTHEVLSDVQIEDQLTGLEIYNNELYVIGNKGIYRMTADLQVEEVATVDCSNGEYVNWAYVFDGSYYIFVRKQQRELINGDYQYGQLVQVDLRTLESNNIPIMRSKKNTLDDILIFPTTMFK